MQGNILVISAYALTLKFDSSVKNRFYKDEELIMPAGDKNRFVHFDDVKARVENDHEFWEGCLGCIGVGKMNKNGHRLPKLYSRLSLNI